MVVMEKIEVPLMRNSTGSRAFTLSELLIAIGAIAVLAAVLVPVALHVKARATQNTCASNLRQIVMAIQAYGSDYNGWLPDYSNEMPGAPPQGFETLGDPDPAKLHAALYPYSRSKKVWFCPTDPFAGQKVSLWGVYHLYSSYRFYFCNTETVQVRLDVKYVRFSKLKKDVPASKVVIVEDANAVYDTGMPKPDPPQNRPGCNHFGGLNRGYLDGHVKWWNLREMNERDFARREGD